MAEKRLIKQRIQATDKTYQITTAMNMVSTAKLRRTEKVLLNFRPLSSEVQNLMNSLLSTHPDVSSPALFDNGKKPCYVIIASDRGLIGGYNNQIFRTFENYVKSHHTSKDEFVVATIGYKAYSYIKKAGYHLLNKEATSIRDDILFQDFNEVTRLIVMGYLKEEHGKTTVFYTPFINTMTSKVVVEQILPIVFDPNKTTNDPTEYIYEPNPQTIFQETITLWISYTLYRIILESKTSEHAARMTAMKNASDNARDIKEQLTLKYNHARQNQITTEITDIINGSSAVK